MRIYYLSLAGYVVRMQLAKDVIINERLQPFILQIEDVKEDFVLDVRSCRKLPEVTSGGCWRGTEYYVYDGHEFYIFHANEVSKAPFAVTYFREDGNVSLLYLSDYEHYFTGSSGIFNRICAEQLLLQHNRLMLHASFIKYKEKAILFSAPSGTGKSTQAELWRRTMSAEIINGDRAAVGFKDAEWTAWGMPYAGTSGIYRNESAPIHAIVVLRQAKKNRICRLSDIDALRYLYPEVTIHQWDAKYVEKVTCLLTKLISVVPVFLLECLPDESAVLMLQEKLSKS